MLYLVLIPLAFVCEFLDSSLGMGFGTTLAPVLLLLGFEPLQVIPALLLSEFISGLAAAVFHHKAANVDFSAASRDVKVAAGLSALSVFGVIAAVLLAIKLSPFVLKVWIGAIVLSMGIIILATLNRRLEFSWSKIAGLGLVASFNKGMSGGGYGPLVMGGQLLSGVGVKNAVGITSLSEAVTCFAGVIAYFFLSPQPDWSLAPWLTAGSVLSVPFAVYTVKRIPENTLRVVIAMVIITLGLSILAKVVP